VSIRAPGGAVDAALADTSIFIARESGRSIGELPPLIAVSVVTIGELRLGVLSASDPRTRARRAATLALARAADPLPINEAVFESWARVVSSSREAGMGSGVKVTDALIAATAIEHGLPVVSQDADFARIAEVVDELEVLIV
jgi:predicted nucleic acid-binding protein